MEICLHRSASKILQEVLHIQTHPRWKISSWRKFPANMVKLFLHPSLAHYWHPSSLLSQSWFAHPLICPVNTTDGSIFLENGSPGSRQYWRSYTTVLKCLCCEYLPSWEHFHVTLVSSRWWLRKDVLSANKPMQTKPNSISVVSTWCLRYSSKNSHYYF